MRNDVSGRRRQPRQHPAGPTTSPFEAGFFARLGEAAQAIGKATFHETLLDLLGSLIAHDSVWIIRYSPNLAPEVLHTVGVSGAIVAWYRETYSAFDPFARFWRSGGQPGVTTLGRALTPSAESELYVMVFQVIAGFADELALLLALPGGSCLALFLQRNQSRFTPEEEALARLVFPTLSGLHRAHVGRLMLELKSVADHPGLRPELPSLIVDSGGRELHANRLWRDAERRLPGLRALPARPKADGAAPIDGAPGMRLRIESFGADFPLAPSGRMYVLEDRAEPPPHAAADGAPGTADLLPPVTPRERDILALILKGQTTGEIAQTLGIGKGTIKNYRLRLYRKAGVRSERALVALFMPLLSGRR